MWTFSQLIMISTRRTHGEWWDLPKLTVSQKNRVIIIFIACSQTLTFFSLIETSSSFEMSHYFLCVFLPETSSLFQYDSFIFIPILCCPYFSAAIWSQLTNVSWNVSFIIGYTFICVDNLSETSNNLKVRVILFIHIFKIKLILMYMYQGFLNTKVYV